MMPAEIVEKSDAYRIERVRERAGFVGISM
jgi:hypothetical protein